MRRGTNVYFAIRGSARGGRVENIANGEQSMGTKPDKWLGWTETLEDGYCDRLYIPILHQAKEATLTFARFTQRITNSSTFMSVENMSKRIGMPKGTVEKHLARLTSLKLLDHDAPIRPRRRTATYSVPESTKQLIKDQNFLMLPFWANGRIRNMSPQKMPWSARLILAAVVSRLAVLKSVAVKQFGEDYVDTEYVGDDFTLAQIEEIRGATRFRFSIEQLKQLTGLSRESIVTGKRFLAGRGILTIGNSNDISRLSEGLYSCDYGSDASVHYLIPNALNTTGRGFWIRESPASQPGKVFRDLEYSAVGYEANLTEWERYNTERASESPPQAPTPTSRGTPQAPEQTAATLATMPALIVPDAIERQQTERLDSRPRLHDPEAPVPDAPSVPTEAIKAKPEAPAVVQRSIAPEIPPLECWPIDVETVALPDGIDRASAAEAMKLWIEYCHTAGRPVTDGERFAKAAFAMLTDFGLDGYKAAVAYSIANGKRTILADPERKGRVVPGNGGACHANAS